MSALDRCLHCGSFATLGHVADCVNGACRWCGKKWEIGLHRCVRVVTMEARDRNEDRFAFAVADRFKTAALVGTVLRDERLPNGDLLRGWWRVVQMVYTVTYRAPRMHRWEFTVERDPPPVPMKDCDVDVAPRELFRAQQPDVVVVPPSTYYPCNSVVTHERAAHLSAEGDSGPACIQCGWWLVEVTTHQDTVRRFVHAKPVLRRGVLA